MKFTKRKGDTSTIRKVYSGDKATCYGVVGKIGDLLKAGILERSNYPDDLWLFLSDCGAFQNHMGKTRDEALELLEKHG